MYGSTRAMMFATALLSIIIFSFIILVFSGIVTKFNGEKAYRLAFIISMILVGIMSAIALFFATSGTMTFY